MILNLCKMAIFVLIAFSAVTLYVKTRHLPFARIKSFLLSKRKTDPRVFAAVFVFAFAVFLGFNMNKNYSKQAVITLNYTEASKAQNSNGTRFDMAEIICSDVLNRAIEKGGFEGVSAKNLKKCLSVSPVVQGDSSSEDNYHISTEFVVKYTASTKTAKLNAENVVKLIGDAYKEFYIDKYADDFSVMDFKEKDIRSANENDYPDIIEYLQKQAQIISNYMYGLAEENSSFTSSDGETFNSLAAKIKNLNDEQIEKNLKAYVYQNGISKNAPEYIKRLEYKNTLLDYDAQRARSSYNTRNTAVNMYSAEMTRIVLVPTRDTGDEFYMGRTKVGIDELSVQAQDYSKQSEDLYKQIETNRTFSAALKNSSYPGGNDKDLDELIAGIEDVLGKYTRRATRLGQEYSDTRINNCVSVSVTDNSFASKAVSLVILSLLFFFALKLFAIAKELMASNDVNMFFTDGEKEIG